MTHFKWNQNKAGDVWTYHTPKHQIEIIKGVTQYIFRVYDDFWETQIHTSDAYCSLQNAQRDAVAWVVKEEGGSQC